MKKIIASSFAAASLIGGAQAAIVYTYNVSDYNTAALTSSWGGSSANVIQGGFDGDHYLRQNIAGDFHIYLDDQNLGLSTVNLADYEVGNAVASLEWLVRGGTQFQQHTIGNGEAHGVGFFTRWNNQDNAGFVIGGNRIQETTFDAALVATDSWKTFTINFIKASDTDVSLQLFIGDSETANLTSSSTVAWSTISAYDGLSSRTVNQFVGLSELNIDVIPEPSAALLGGFGLLALLRRRR